MLQALQAHIVMSTYCFQMCRNRKPLLLFIVSKSLAHPQCRSCGMMWWISHIQSVLGCINHSDNRSYGLGWAGPGLSHLLSSPPQCFSTRPREMYANIHESSKFSLINVMDLGHRSSLDHLRLPPDSHPKAWRIRAWKFLCRLSRICTLPLPQGLHMEVMLTTSGTDPQLQSGISPR